MKPLILHISNDYPDPLRPDKTSAIQRLVESTPEYRHVVYSLNRVNGWSGIASVPFGEDRIAVAYGALPKGLFWGKRLDDVARWMRADLKSKKIVPQLIQAHKLTVEGLIGQLLAQEFHCPLICDIQGGTDLRVLKIKKNLHKRYRSVAQASALIFPYAPWVIEPFSALIGLDPAKCHCLPVLPGFETLAPSSPSPSPRLITLLRFNTRKNKNVAGLVAAMQRLSGKYPTLTLDIYGGGAADGLLRIQRLLRRAGMSERILCKGPIANNLLPQVLGGYSALVMPSFSETYGLVYAEALFCGVPVLFSKGRGIDGYFDTASIGYACDPASPADIAAGIDHLLTHEAGLKSGIARMQADGALDRIRSPAIVSLYRKGLETVLSRHAI